MNDFATLVMRLEFPDSQLATWVSSELDVESYEPADGGDGGLITQAIDEGSLEAVPSVVDQLLDYLDAADDGWVIERTPDAVGVHVNGMVGGDDPTVNAVRGAIASQLFAHAIETAGARGYFYMLDFYTEDELPTTARIAGAAGVLERDDLGEGDPQDRMDFIERVRGRLLDARALWPVADDDEGR